MKKVPLFIAVLLISCGQGKKEGSQEKDLSSQEQQAQQIESQEKVLVFNKPKTDWDERNLKGKVKKITAYTYPWVQNEETGDYFKVEKEGYCMETQFNPQGFISSVCQYESVKKKKVALQYHYHYNTQGQLDTLRYSMQYSGGKYDFVEAFHYDAVGNKIQRDNYKNGQLENREFYSAEQTLKGKCMEVIGGQRKTPYKVWIYFDAQDREIKNEYYQDNQLKYTTLYTYDQEGKCIKTDTQESDGYRQVTTYTYDEYGNKTKEKREITSFEGAEPREEIYYESQEYDSKGNIIEQYTAKEASRTVTYYEIEYYE